MAGHRRLHCLPLFFTAKCNNLRLKLWSTVQHQAQPPRNKLVSFVETAGNCTKQWAPNNTSQIKDWQVWCLLKLSLQRIIVIKATREATQLPTEATRTHHHKLVHTANIEQWLIARFSTMLVLYSKVGVLVTGAEGSKSVGVAQPSLLESQ